MKLVPYDERTITTAQLTNYSLPDDQLVFSALPVDAVERAKKDPDLHPLMLLDQSGKLLVFFMLHENEGVAPYSDNPNSLYLRSFSTDYHSQGKGYARKALQLLDSYVAENFPRMNEIVLGVNSKNDPAIHLYQACGFTNEVKRLTTEYGQLIVLSKKLKGRG